MKARVKATGEIGIVSQIDVLLKDDFVSFSSNKVEILQSYADATIDPDYWARLEHQYAGMAMQTMLATLYNPKYHKELMACYTEVDAEEVARLSKYYAHALVEKMKENEKAMH